MTKKKAIIYIILISFFFSALIILLSAAYHFTNIVLPIVCLSLSFFGIIGLIILFFLKFSINKTVSTVLDYIYFCISALLVLTIIVTFFFQVHTVEGTSMIPSLKDNETVVLFPFKYQTITNNDIIVISQGDRLLVKRVFAKAGDSVHLEEISGRICIVNDNTSVFHPNTSLGESKSITKIEWERMTNSADIMTNYVLPPDTYIAFGDNFDISSDSRTYGLFIRSNIIGKILFK